MNTSIKKVAIILAAGKSVRFGNSDKMLYKIFSENVISLSVKTFLESNLFDKIVVVCNKSNFNEIVQLMRVISTDIEMIIGGDRRQDSVKCALDYLGDSYDYLAIHDGARPFVSNLMIKKGLEILKDFDSAIPGYPINDTVKYVEDERVMKNFDRQNLFLVQTPQFFLYQKMYSAYQKHLPDMTDDAALFVDLGLNVIVFEGEKTNLKITDENDLEILEQFYKMKFEK